MHMLNSGAQYVMCCLNRICFISYKLC